MSDILDQTSPIYIDNHATTRVDPRVVESMMPHFVQSYGNASSRSHAFGWEAEKAVEKGREQVALLLGADPREIVFTSGATESNNLALKGAAEVLRKKGNRILSSPTEHPSVLDSLAWLRGRGFEIVFLPVDARGRVAPEAVEAAIVPGTILLSLMAANNEVGTVHPIERIGRICAERGVLLHCDATQAVGRIPFRAAWVHLASLTAHKIHGPKGVGALCVRRRDPEVRIEKQIHGGGQERGMRSGTLNVPGIVGLGRAAEICRLEGEEESRRIAALRDLLRERLRGAFPDLVENGDPEGRLPGNLNVAFPGTASDAVMMSMPDVALSAGSACASGSIEPSHVMKAMKVRPDIARASLRFGIGRFNTREEVERVASRVIQTVERLRRR